MPTSFQQTLSLTCPRCGQSFEAAIWLIVDAAERPDLLEKIQAGTLHQVVCPHCQFQWEVDAPLLLYNPPLPEGEGLGVRLLFSPAQGTTAEQGQEQALALLERLRQSLGNAWQGDWLSRGLPAVLRPFLPLALREGLGAAQRKMQEEAAEGRIAAELGALLEEIARLRRPSEMPRKVELCERALAMVEREDNPALWGALQGELANALAQNPLGNRAENLEKAIHHFRQALEVYTRQAYPEQWAATQHNLGSAYAERMRGERAENLEQAIFHFQQALEVYTRQLNPERWVAIHNHLANAHRKRIRGDHAENIEQAIFHYQQAIVTAREIGDKNSCSHISLELGKLYIKQGRWYDALHLFEESLAIYREGDDLDARADAIYQIARTHHLIGNLDKARTHYRDALRLYEHIRNQSGIALCRTGLGGLMFQMGFLDDAIRELELAKRAYREMGEERRAAEVEEMLQMANQRQSGFTRV